MGVKGKRDGAPVPGRQTGPRGKLSLAPKAETVDGKPEPGKKPAAKLEKKPDPKQPALPTMEKRGIKALDEAGARLLAAKVAVADAKKDYDRADAASQEALKKHRRKYYRYGVIEMWLDEGKKHPKIKVVKPKEDETKK